MLIPRFKRRNQARSAETERIYAIGDIHGRLDLLQSLMEMIECELATPGRPLVTLVILGDFIDRGPNSASVIDVFQKLDNNPRITVLKGNHEAALVDAIGGNHDALEGWLAQGGTATLESYGVDPSEVDMANSRAAYRLVCKTIPRSTVQWLARLPTSLTMADHYFVHAGVKPGIELDRQCDDDRLWIRDEFTESAADHGAVVVHGHTVYEDGVHFASNRIGIDTGAYRTGRLSALVIENGCYRTLSTQPASSS